MLLTGCCGLKEALRSVDRSVLILLWSALGLAKAAQLAGFHGALLSGTSLLEGASIPAVLFGLYLTTWLLTEFLTNAAAAALIFPVVVTVAEMQQLDVVPLALLSMVAASSSFITPYGNQTNLMVHGPGGYRIADFLRVGGGLNVLTGVIVVALIPWVWPF